MQYLIALELCKAAGLTDLENEIYMRCAEQVFWDGALKQFVTILDDFGQQKDSTSNPNIEFFELIRMIGPFHTLCIWLVSMRKIAHASLLVL